MKQWISLVFAGMLGGLVTFAGTQWLAPEKLENDQSSMVARAVNWSPPAAAVPTFDFSEAADRTVPSVVSIKVTAKPEVSRGRGDLQFWSPFEEFFGRSMPREGAGSGVIYSADGYILTNNHVVESADQIEVVLFDKRKFNATIIGTDPKTDLAVIKIESNDLPVIGMGDSDAAKVGQWVLAVGNPFDLASTVTAGIISAKGRNIDLLGKGAIESFIQTDAAVNPGNSGGALVDATGLLVGINSAIATRTGSFAGYSFAIPINLARRIADDIIAHGSYQRAFLGISISDLDGKYAQELGVDHLSQGVVVEELLDGGSAQYAGILPKDVITEVDGKTIKSVAELQEVVGRARVNDILNLTLFRKGKRMELPVRLRKGNS
jgi:Do/DeqQ family serine protease